MQFTHCSASLCTGKARPTTRRRETEEAKRKEKRNKYGNEENEISSPQQEQHFTVYDLVK
jgi:hypothetical protein